MIRFYYFLLLSIVEVICFTHWILSNEGKITAKEQSAYLLQYPHDLAALTHQERAFQLYNEEDVENNGVLGSMSVGNSFQSPEHGPHKINCDLAINALGDFHFYESTIISIGDLESVIDVLEKINVESESSNLEPFCNKFSVPFFMGGFEHLESVFNQDILSMAPELTLMDVIPSTVSLKKFGHIIAVGLAKNTTSWFYYDLASLYWRILGSPKNSIQCIKNALKYAPRNYKHICLLSFGNVLHQSFYSKDALILLHASLDHDSSEPVIHYMLGNVYALLGDYDKSLEHYNNALVLDQYFLNALKRMNTLLCHRDQLPDLKNQQTSFQTTLYQVFSLTAEKLYWIKKNKRVVIETSDLRLRAHFDNNV